MGQGLASPRNAATASRLPQLDLLRGAVMVVMTLDHAREYASGPGGLGDPMDLSTVTPLLYGMRWVTHFCAPWFALLMGISAWLSVQSRSTAEASRHLLLRGAILLLLEFTLIDWSWTFNPLWPRKFFQVIAALGCGLIAIGLLQRYGRDVVGLCGVAILALHNAFDSLRFAPDTLWHYAWSVLHQKNVLPLVAGFEVRTTYPVLPIIGVACAGFWLGEWMRTLPASEARQRFLRLGLLCAALFLLLRVPNLYGDASQFTVQPTWLYTLFSLGNVTKYPLSLHFVLMTLAPLFLLLAWMHGRPLAGWPRLRLLGQVPMFFYIGHLYALHALALLWALLQGFPLNSFRFQQRFGGIPEGFGFPLWMTLPFAAVTILLLLPLCRRYAELRRSKRYPWMAYL